MNLKLMINIKDIDKDGNVFNECEFEANSLVKAFIGILAGLCYVGSTTVSVSDTGNISRTATYISPYLRSDAAVGDITKGIVVGTSSTAVAVSDYKLGTIVSHGTGSGQLSYGAMEVLTSYTTSGSNSYFEVRRAITNNSGADITTEEIGYYGFYSSYSFCIDRTIYNKTITNGNGIVITYKFQVTV